MSRVYFHSEHSTAELRGSERAHMGVLIGDILVATLRCSIDNDTPSSLSPLRRVVSDGYWTKDFHRSMPLALRSVTGDLRFDVAGTSHEAWVVGLNTALAIGNDTLKLFARIHGQCEIHGYVLGPNRAWLAGIVDRGRAQSLCRKDEGWESVTNLLRESDSGPVVMSYSVCDAFPNANVADWSDEHEGNDWYDLEPARRWELAMAGLWRQSKRPELTPDDWEEYTFGAGLNAFQLLEYATAQPVLADKG